MARRSLGTGEADKVALYLRVAQSLRSRIRDGEWTANTQLPTIHQLAEEYGVALVTVRQAIALLVADGLLTSTRGKGTFVTSDVLPVRANADLKTAINSQTDSPENFSIEVLDRKRTRGLTKQFIDGPEKRYPSYVTIKKLHLEGGEPFSLVYVSVARHIHGRFPPDAEAEKKIFRIVLETGSLELQSSRIEMTVVYADAEMASLLQCPVLSALVRIRSVRVDTEGKIAIASDSYYRGDKFIYELEEYSLTLDSTTSLALPHAKRG